MARDYVDYRDDGYWIAGARVSLDSVVYAFLRGESPERIVQSFPLLNLEEVYGAIAFYLSHQPEVDALLQRHDQEFEALRKQSRAANPALHKKIEEARQNLPASRP